MSYENIFEGGYSSFNPQYGAYVGYRLEPGKIGSPTSIQTANQIAEVAARIKEGVKNVELQPISQDVFEQIPEAQMREISALMRLTGVKPSLHAPMIDPAGFGEKGWGGEEARREAERRLLSVVMRSHELDRDGKMPITIHPTAGIPGMEYEAEKQGEDMIFKPKKMIIINKETGQLNPIELEAKYRIGYTKEKLRKGETPSPEEELEIINHSEWAQKLTNMQFYQKEVDEMLGNSPLALKDDFGKEINEELMKSIVQDPEKRESFMRMQKAEGFISHIGASLNSVFERAYKFGTPEQKEELEGISEQYLEAQKKIGRRILGSTLKRRELLDQTISQIAKITEDTPPQLYVPVEDFAMGKASQTLGNVAYGAYKEYKDKAPIISVENIFPGWIFSKSEKLKELIEKSKSQFVDNATKNGMEKKKAEKKADELIGVTWDVGHLNMIRKAGFTEKEIVSETEKIAKLVKHVHMTDNFGFSDSHLPPGMGNVPIRKIMEKLEKEGFSGRTIIEAGGFVQQFKKSPHPFVLSAFGSPIYGMKAQPYWNQMAGTQGNYFASPLAYMPEKHFSIYGGGFSSLPQEVGGVIPGTQSRFSGTANA